MEIQWDDMRIFLSVARTDSLSAAARVLKRDAATVGRRIARLESALGAALFAKSPQGYRLTEAGQRFVAHAEQAEQAMLAAKDELRGDGEALSGTIRVGAPDGCANFLLPRVCVALTEMHPDLDIQIVALPRVFNLPRREADMAIAVSPPSGGRLSVQKIADYHLSLAAHRDYLTGAPALNSLEDLRHHRMVGYVPDMIFDKELDYLGGIGIDRVALSSNSVAVQFQWLAMGAGVGVVHDFALPAAPGLVRVLADQVRLTRTFWLIRHADDHRTVRLNRFAGFLVDGVRAELARLETMARPDAMR